MRDHLRILGILNIILGSLSALAGVIVFFVVGGAAGIIAAGVSSSNDPDVQKGLVAAPIIGVIGLGIAIFLILLSLPSIIGGWGLMHFRPWSRVLMLIVSVFHLFSFPLGTAVGIYGFWVLLNEESRRLLETGGQFGALPVTGVAASAPGLPMTQRPGEPPTL